MQKATEEFERYVQYLQELLDRLKSTLPNPIWHGIIQPINMIFRLLVNAWSQMESQEMMMQNEKTIEQLGMKMVALYRDAILSDDPPEGFKLMFQGDARQMLCDMCYPAPYGMGLPSSLKAVAGKALVDILVDDGLCEMIIEEIIKGKLPDEARRYALDNLAPAAVSEIDRYFSDPTRPFWSVKKKISYILTVARRLDRLNEREEPLGKAWEYAFERAIDVFEKEGTDEVMTELSEYYRLPTMDAAAMQILEEFKARLQERKQKMDGEFMDAPKLTKRPVMGQKPRVERIRYEVIPKKKK